MKEKTCIALFSGGLDSMIAVKLLEKQGIKVIPVNFNIGVFFKKYIRENGELKYNKPLPAGMQVMVVDITKDFLHMLKNPAHGYGKNMNPCIDCKILMMRKAKEMMKKLNAGFVITGEVLGQRPMTQNSHSINMIKDESGLEGYLLRPLSAKLMEPTEPEKLGWVDREQLLAIEGRNRKEQLSLAVEFGLTDVMETPGGGCLLTDEHYAARLNDLIQHNKEKEITERDMFLLSAGRHFRKNKIKFIIGRHSEDNEKLEQVKEGAMIFEVMDIPGPLVLTFDSPDEETIKEIAAAAAGYTKLRDKEEVSVKILNGGNEKIIKVKPISREEAEKYKV